jgi:hypothetical protein
MDQAQALRSIFATEHDWRARKRILVILLTLRRNLSVLQIAHRLGLARSTVFAYRRLYALGGIRALLAHTSRGRPPTPVSPRLDQVIVKGLRLLSWFNVPMLRKWISYHDRDYPSWTVRRWALMRIKRLRIKFPRDWRAEMANSYQQRRSSTDRTGPPHQNWQRQRTQPEAADPICFPLDRLTPE